MKSRLGIATVLIGSLVAAILAATAGGAEITVTCKILSEGPAGPRGDVLKIVDEADSVTSIDVKEGELIIFNNLDSESPKCAGGTPTVSTIDSIEYRTSHGAPFIGFHSDGPIGPGATPEPGSGSEIEIKVVEEDEPPVLNVAATDEGDSVAVGMVDKATVGVNLDVDADGSSQDADVTIKAEPGSDSFIRVAGRGGDDEMSALGGPGFVTPPTVGHLLLLGGTGDDRLAGGPGPDSLVGELGNDLLLGGRGRDSLAVGPGHDIAKGGKGPDRIENRSSVGGIPDDLAPDLVFGGAGNDHVDVVSEHGGDQVDCGSGGHDQVRMEPDDHQHHCEKVETQSL